MPLENNQYYDVLFDGEGEALVLAKLTFKNNDDTNWTTIPLEIPGQVRVITGLQYLGPVYYQESYVKPQYLNPFWYPASTFSKKIDFTQQQTSGTNIVTIMLDYPLPPGETITFFFYYKAKGYVNTNLFSYSFVFETIKNKYDSNQVRVAVNVQPELYLKGTESRVNYVDNMYAAKMSAGEALASEEMKELSQRIESAPGLIKTTAGLDPFESFIVTGEYTKYHWWLQRWTIVGWALLILLGGIVLLYAFRKASSFLRTVSPPPLSRKATRESAARDRTAPSILRWGFFSAIASILSLRVIVIISKNMYRWAGSSYELAEIMIVLTAILTVGSILLLPPVYVGYQQKNVLAGLLTVAATAGWLVVLSIMMILLLGKGGGFF